MIPIPPDCERVPSAGIDAGSPDAGRETMSISLDFKRVLGSVVTAGATDAGWETLSIPPDRAHMPGAGVAVGALGPDLETVRVVQYPRHGRQACPKFISLHQGVDQICPQEYIFRAMSYQKGNKLVIPLLPL